MIKETIQKSLFETPELFSSSQFTKTEPRNLDKNSAVSFGITKTGLNKGSYGTLENIFYGINNLEIPLEMLSVENPAEILANYFAAGSLKRGNLHLNPGVPNGFLELMNYINRYSYSDVRFSSLAHKFKKYFDSSPGKQRERLGFLEQNIRKRFVESFFIPYRPSNKEEPFEYAFYDPNCDGRDKGIYANRIYKELKSLNEKAKINAPL